jgi:hypothetical protein
MRAAHTKGETMTANKLRLSTTCAALACTALLGCGERPNETAKAPAQAPSVAAPATPAPPPPAPPAAPVAVESSCLSPLVVSVVQDILSEGVEARAREENKGMPENRRLDLSKVRAIAAQVRVDMQDVLTSKNDPNSTKKFCEGTLSLSINADEMAKADDLRRRNNLNSIRSVAEDAGFRVDINKFTRRVSYSVQPTDDRSKLYVSLDNSASFVSLVGEAALWAVANSAGGQVQSVSPAVAGGPRAAAPELAPVSPQDEGLRDELNRSQQRFHAAEREINVVWRALPQVVRDEHLPAQRQFNKDKESNCFRKASEAGAGARFEITKNNCWADLYDKRTAELKALN